MALVAVEPPSKARPSQRPVKLPAVMITSCDPWPRPYYFEGGLRRVRPYHFTYNTSCKERWRNREILEIFGDEFRDRPVEYYKDAIEKGAIMINGKPAPSINTIVKNGDMISHVLHRHEPPVTSMPIGIVHEDDGMLVINKPAGVPVHPTGRYNYNSVTEIIRSERYYSMNPMPCNRLDRLTSGIMFIGKTKHAATKMTVQIQERNVRKEYIARVRGEFPAEEVVCEQPIRQISSKLGLNRVRANGKEARTVFRRLAYYPSEKGDGYSIVHCFPLTGRTHQLRVHLQFLGHPITNDPIYSNRKVFGLGLGKADDTGSDDETVMERLSRMGKQEVAEAIAYHEDLVDQAEKKKAEMMTGKNCEVCDTPLYADPGEHELGIYLHAMKYACSNGTWSYETPMPEWALPPTIESGEEKSAVNAAMAETVSQIGDDVASRRMSLDGDSAAV